MTSQQGKLLVGFAGMTHLGIVMSAVTTEHGYDTRAFHPGKPPDVPKEPGLTEFVLKHSINVSTSPDELSGCDLVFVSLDTPLDAVNRPDEEPVRDLIRSVIPHLKRDAVLVIMSQVSPGFTRSINYPQDQLFYQVETLVFGDSVKRALEPERIIVGCAEPGNLSRVYHNFLREFVCPILPMSYESAELTKIAINVMLVASISATNTLAEVCEVTGADWAEIEPALRLDKRIGQHAYLTPGLGLGGGHIERDLHALLNLSDKVKFDDSVLNSFVVNSWHRQQWLFDSLGNLQVDQEPIVTILGLAYKVGTNSTVNSPGLALAARLHLLVRVRMHDPVVSSHQIFGATALDCIDGADALVIATPWPEYRDLKVRDLHQRMRGRLLVDPYRVLDGAEAVTCGFEYHTLGARPKFPA